MKIHLATDHAGLDLKNSIKNYLLKKEYFVELHIDDVKVSESWGESIKSAEQNSSEIAIKIVN